MSARFGTCVCHSANSIVMETLLESSWLLFSNYFAIYKLLGSIRFMKKSELTND